MGFKDFENKVKDVKGVVREDHQKAVEQSIAVPDNNDTAGSR